MRLVSNLLAVAFALATLSPGAAAATAVKVAGEDAVLDAPAAPRASLVLVPGDAGLSESDPLQRMKMKFVDKGLAVLSIDQKTVIRAAMRTAADTATPVSIAAVSSGARRLAGAIAGAGFRARRVVLVSGNLDSVRETVGNAELLPQTLVIHHRNDGCPKTPPSQVAAFQQWGGSRVTVLWLEGGGNSGDPCGPQSHHGLAGLDDRVVEAIAGYLDN